MSTLAQRLSRDARRTPGLAALWIWVSVLSTATLLLCSVIAWNGSYRLRCSVSFNQTASEGPDVTTLNGRATSDCGSHLWLLDQPVGSDRVYLSAHRPLPVARTQWARPGNVCIGAGSSDDVGIFHRLTIALVNDELHDRLTQVAASPGQGDAPSLPVEDLTFDDILARDTIMYKIARIVERSGQTCTA